MKILFKEKEKGSSKGKTIECYKCGALRLVSSNHPSPKDVKKSIQATWSNTDSNESDSLTPRDTRYGEQHYLAFITLIGSNHDTDGDCNSEFNHNTSITEKWCEEYQFY